jgi:hypothetical protein
MAAKQLGEQMIEKMDNCKNIAAHAKDKPSGYLEWHKWAEEMEKTHNQTQCPHCGYWVIWNLKTDMGPKK